MISRICHQNLRGVIVSCRRIPSVWRDVALEDPSCFGWRQFYLKYKIGWQTIFKKELTLARERWLANILSWSLCIKIISNFSCLLCVHFHVIMAKMHLRVRFLRPGIAFAIWRQALPSSCIDWYVAPLAKLANIVTRPSRMLVKVYRTARKSSHILAPDYLGRSR